MTGHATIAALRQLLSAAATAEWIEHDTVSLSLASPLDFAPLRELSEAGVAVILSDALQASYDRYPTAFGNVGMGEVIRLKFPLTLEGFIATRSLEHLLSLPEACIREPAAYALFDNKALGAKLACTTHIKGADLTDANDSIVGYHQAINLWNLLEKLADHVEADTGSLLFFGVRRTEIRPGFTLSEFPPRDAIQKIEAFVSDSDRRETRLQIFQAALSDFLRDQLPQESFGYLLHGCDRFARRLREGLAIYLSEHSPQKLADEAKSAALSLSEKLEKVITGIETKSLTIPVALILAVKDVDHEAGLTPLNLAVIVASLLFAVTMILVHRSQLSLLGGLLETITITRDDYGRKGLETKNPILATHYGSLETRCYRARTGSWIVCFASWTPLLLSIFAMCLAPAPRKAVQNVSVINPLATMPMPPATPPYGLAPSAVADEPRVSFPWPKISESRAPVPTPPQ
jgi:hypothetical protein